MYLLPSLFTAGSLGAGYFSITQTIAALDGSGQAHTHLDWAAIAILFAIPFDAARWPHCAHDQHRQRIRQGAGFAGRCHHLRHGAKPSGVRLGIPFPSRFDEPAAAATPAAGGRFHLLSFSSQRSIAAGALQHQPRRTAAEPRPCRPEVLCRHADPCRGGPAGRDSSFLQGLPGRRVVGRRPLADACRAVPDS